MFILQKNSFTYTLFKNQKTSDELKKINLVNSLQIGGFSSKPKLKQYQVLKSADTSVLR